MRIGIDARPLSRPNSGIGSYVTNLAKAMMAMDSDHWFFLFVHERPPWLKEAELPPHFHLVRVPSYPIDQLQDQLGLASMIHKTRVHVFHATHHDATPLLVKVPLVVTVHDIAPMDFHNPALVHRSYYRFFSELAFRRASRLICDSDSTGNRVEQRFPFCRCKWTRIHLGCDSYFQISDTSHSFPDLASRLGIHGPFLLYVGSFARRKNLPNMMEAFSMVRSRRPQVQFVIVGGPSGRDDVFPAEIPDGVIVAGHVTPSVLRALYHRAELLMFTTLYEGFGVPILEALACGCPVVTSPLTSLPEVAGDAALYAAPDQPGDIAEQAIRILEEDDLRKKLVERGQIQVSRFSWEIAAHHTIATYHQVSSASREQQ